MNLMCFVAIFIFTLSNFTYSCQRSLNGHTLICVFIFFDLLFYLFDDANREKMRDSVYRVSYVSVCSWYQVLTRKGM